MGKFFVNTEDGRVATQSQLIEAGLADSHGEPRPPWHRIQGPRDASTMWYGVLRKPEHGVFIGALCFRQAPRFASLQAAGWEEVPVDAIGVEAEPGRPASAN
ncbi:MAG: hypothetical protein M3088_02710 [Actinomycetota bacterium]|nr:hypothetical protein [Actinomycetota bacterium]